MVIEIDNESKKWIQAKGNQLTVKVLVVDACCAPEVQGIVAIPGKPNNMRYFNEFQVEDQTIYVQKTITVKEKLILKLSGFSFLKSISAKLQ